MKTMQLILNQAETNNLLLALEVAMDAISSDIGSTDKLSDFSTLWDEIFDSGIEAGFTDRQREE